VKAPAAAAGGGRHDNKPVKLSTLPNSQHHSTNSVVDDDANAVC